MYFMSVNATFAVAVRTRKVSRRPSTFPTTGNILILHKTLYGPSNRAGLNDGLFQKRWTFVTLPSVLKLSIALLSLCVSRRIDTWHIVYLSNKDPCPKILAHKFK